MSTVPTSPRGRSRWNWSAAAPRALLQAANFVQSIADRQGLMIACLEEIAWRLGWIDAADVERLGRKMQGNHYGQYLLRIVSHDRHGGAH